MTEQTGNKKILVTGLDNSGKTSIILSMQGNNNLLSFYSLRPTQHVKVETIEAPDMTFYLWEVGGQSKYRKDFLANFTQYSEDIEKIIFIIDIQDQDRYNMAIQYLEKILQNFIQNEINIKLVVFLHKFDPKLLDDLQYSPKALENGIVKQIKLAVPSLFPVEIYKTTIYTVFQKQLV